MRGGVGVNYANFINSSNISMKPYLEQYVGANFHGTLGTFWTIKLFLCALEP